MGQCLPRRVDVREEARAGAAVLGEAVCVGRKHSVGFRLMVTVFKEENLFSFAFFMSFSHCGGGPVQRVTTPLGILEQVPGNWLLSWLVQVSAGMLRGGLSGFPSASTAHPR